MVAISGMVMYEVWLVQVLIVASSEFECGLGWMLGSLYVGSLLLN